MTMRQFAVVLVCLLFVACHRASEVRGMYVNDDSSGTLFPCGDPKVAIAVPDSALTARYRATVVANKPVFVRLRGMSWAISPKRSDGASGSLASANCRVSRGVRRANPSRPP